MAIPQRISFLEESRSWGMTNLHSSGIEEYKIYSSGSSGNFEEWVIPKILKIPPKIQKKCEKKNFSIEFILQSPKYSVIIPKIDRLSWKTEWKTEKSRQIAENCPIFSISRSSANFGEDSRSRGVIKSIPRGIEEWKKVRDLEDRGTRNSLCHPFLKLHVLQLGTSNSNNWGIPVLQNCTSDTP